MVPPAVSTLGRPGAAKLDLAQTLDFGIPPLPLSAKLTVHCRSLRKQNGCSVLEFQSRDAQMSHCRKESSGIRFGGTVSHFGIRDWLWGDSATLVKPNDAKKLYCTKLFVHRRYNLSLTQTLLRSAAPNVARSTPSFKTLWHVARKPHHHV